MRNVIHAMLSLQSRLNSLTIGPHWQTSDKEDWLLAISQECAEGIDHLAWKWWAKQRKDIEAARMEVVDALHFALSAEMWAAPKGTPLPAIAALIEEQIMDNKAILLIDRVKLDPAKEDPINLFSIISALASVGRCNTGLLFLLAEKLGLSFTSTIQLYQMKATLNLFRLNNGYKEGTYIKHWAPSLEDNYFLPTLAEGIDWTAPDAYSLFYNRLNVRYSEVTEAASRNQH